MPQRIEPNAPNPTPDTAADQPTLDLATAAAATSADTTRPLPDEPAEAAEEAGLAGGRFRILREHRRGGLGRICVARDLELGREVAVKEILGDHADDPSSRARFVLEAEVTGNLEHPGVVPVYALGRHDDGRPYYAMRLIRGASLNEAIEELHRRDHRSRTRAAEFVASLRPLVRRLVDVCDALAYAHSRGVIHRDLKPANVLLGPYGETLVVDWGLAKIVGVPDEQVPPLTAPSSALEDADDSGTLRPASGASSMETLPGRAVGTPAYMSPEQAAGALDRLGPASDVYSLGATLYHLLTGLLPFGGDGSPLVAVLDRVERGALRRPRELEPRVPPALEAICLKAMARRPEDRYPSMAALGADLERWLDDEPVTARREGLTDRMTRWGRRHKAWATTLAVAALAIVGILALTADDFRRAAARERAAREQSLRVAAKFAARTVAAEIDRRWRILEAEAADPELLALMPARREPPASPGRQGLQSWIEARAREHEAAAAASNWFLTDEHGVQIARAPYLAANIGVDYSFRDYFHGRGVDLPPGTPDLAPISHPHRSIVFRSRATGRDMVVFSVPVRVPGGDGAPVLGVLGMSVEVGRFGILQLDVGDDQLAVLVDLRPDEHGRPGRIVHHAVHEGRHAEGDTAYYVDAARVASLRRLTDRATADARRRRVNPETASVGIRPAPRPGDYEAAYRDPVHGPEAGLWHAAFEPVLVEGRPDHVEPIDWVVIVQERPDADETR
jgi:serine/threonine protein kinase